MSNSSGLPSHVALIPDGNRRWARERGLPTLEGHRRGFQAAHKTLERAWAMGIQCVTLWGFSTENWNRSKEEIDYLMNLYTINIDSNVKSAKKNNARIIHLGRKDRIPEKLRLKILQAEEETKNFSEKYMSIGIDYGGRDELVRAVKAMEADKSFDLANVDATSIEKYLDTRDLPQQHPDLIIRTGGEQRMSGFMSWQSGYSEMMYVKKFLPDFTVEDFDQCIAEYQNRQRRFGK